MKTLEFHSLTQLIVLSGSFIRLCIKNNNPDIGMDGK